MTACYPLPWHQTAAARALLGQLAPTDVRLAPVRGLPGPDRLAWVPAGENGMAVFVELTLLYQAAIGPAFAMATDAHARATALDAARRALTVEAVVATRFGDPLRWQGLGPLEATRRFRAHWHGTDG